MPVPGAEPARASPPKSTKKRRETMSVVTACLVIPALIVIPRSDVVHLSSRFMKRSILRPQTKLHGCSSPRMALHADVALACRIHRVSIPRPTKKRFVLHEFLLVVDTVAGSALNSGFPGEFRGVRAGVDSARVLDEEPDPNRCRVPTKIEGIHAASAIGATATTGGHSVVSATLVVEREGVGHRVVAFHFRPADGPRVCVGRAGDLENVILVFHGIKSRATQFRTPGFSVKPVDIADGYSPVVAAQTEPRGATPASADGR